MRIILLNTHRYTVSNILPSDPMKSSVTVLVIVTFTIQYQSLSHAVVSADTIRFRKHQDVRLTNKQSSSFVGQLFLQYLSSLVKQSRTEETRVDGCHFLFSNLLLDIPTDSLATSSAQLVHTPSQLRP